LKRDGRDRDRRLRRAIARIGTVCGRPIWRSTRPTRPREIFDLTFARYLDPGRTDMRAWIAHDAGGRGPCHVIVHAHGWQDAPVTYLQDLYADPEVRGKGVGRALIETVYADADAAGRPNVYWTTQTGNATARRLYDRIAVATDFMKYSRS
jgi:GNAT superfamily N-acetyltransferase